MTNEIFNRKEWMDNECVFTNKMGCAMCPYVVYDELGRRKCEKDLYEKCDKHGLRA